jgi:hypothetical protein
VLQTKQTQYDSNYKALNKIYGQYFYADLTHEDNINRKEELMKNIDFNLKRVSGLDLSLEQNVTQATQVFKPFYEDQYLMKDMAFTKNYNAQKQRAMGLKNSQDEKMRAQYWDTGVRAMDYQRDEFKKSNIAETLDFGNVSYTNYVNVQDKALKIAKEADLSIESVDFSPDGRWIVKTKNGEQLYEPLSKLFEAQLGSDPAVQEVYKTQAYVNRKDYAASNAAQFGGDESAAEMKYLETNYNMLKEQQQKRYKDLQESASTYDAQIKDIQGQIDKGNKNPDLKKTLEKLQQGKEINQSVLDRIEKDNEFLKNESTTATTSTGFVNPYGDVKSLRWKIDNAMASSLMQKDLDEAAEIFAYRNAKQDIQANPYAVNEQQHAFRMQETALANQGRIQAAKIRNQSEKQVNMDKHLVESGAYHYDTNPNSPTYGRAVKNEQYDNSFIDTENVGNVTDEINMKVLSNSISQRQTDTYAVPYLKQTMNLLDKLVTTGVMTQGQADKILSYGKNKNITMQEFNKKLEANPNSFLRSEVGTNGLTWINKKMQWWVNNNKNVSAIASGIPEYNKASTEFGVYTGYLDADTKWRKETSKLVEQKLESQGLKKAKFLYDENGKLRSREEFYKFMSEADKKRINENVASEIFGLGTGFELLGSFLGKGSKAVWNYLTGDTAEMAQALAKIPVSQRSIVERRLKDAAKEAGDYDKYVEAAAKAYKSSTIKNAPPGIGNLGTISGAGLFTPGRQSVFVSPKAFDTKGFAYFREFTNDLRKMDFGDSSKHQITFKGPTAGNIKGDNMKNDVGKILADAIIQEMNNSKSKFKNFKLSSQAIAAGAANKGAMIIRPDREWLKEYVSSNKELNNNLITPDDYKDILTNGISIVSDSNNWKNGLFTSAYMDPIQSYIEYNGKYEFKDNYGNMSGVIRKNPYGVSDYTYDLDYRVLDYETGEYVNYRKTDNTVTTGNNTMNVIDSWNELSERIQQYNNTGTYGY